ncbi:citrulline utilization hydrolase CtlX [Mucilaginibacter sp. KACC 22063]|uniref:citrulline utilization hydrolase CtlX n=1 Tax=Mucilaginibacter sp. KACC 22063 TaxID=3025666 RepID=UPI002366419A|nr:arginine deiminase-related protein [Mucilaginibacter sp. KACC 22063]WDF53734.1 arginine deiminase-related protein [Mucilaginibacter sp. KACC 22063]
MKNKQTTSTLLMIRPVRFGFNEQTAESNAFQNKSDNKAEDIQQKALEEFDNFVDLLRANGVKVIVVNDTVEPHTPDSIFPNNWISFHANGDVLMYPMQAENRRLERREDIIRKIEEDYTVNHVIDLSRFEVQNKFLEGTGSMVLDRENKIAYACLSPRTDKEVLETFAKKEDYKAITFDAVDSQGKAIYHTNVLMCIGSSYVVICLDAIKDEIERGQLLDSFKNTGKEMVAITFDQMNHFAGNMLEVQSTNGEKLLVMSKQAYQSLDDNQAATLEKYIRIICSDISAIETHGGGSARCMLAEVHLQPKN